MRRLRIAAALGAFALVAALAAGGPGASAQSAGGCANADAMPGSVSDAALAGALTCLINAERSSNGVASLRSDGSLLAAEQAHVSDMLANRYLGHRGTDGTLPAARARHAGYLRGYKSFTVGENLAWGQTTLGTPRVILNAWLGSPTHRRNILDGRFREIGSVVQSGAPVAQPPASSATYGVTLGVVKFRKRR